jgi:hypothetical protein
VSKIRRQNTRIRFEQWASNPTCHANIASAVHNVRMARVAQHENPSIHLKENSDFAFQRGILFEKSILENSGERLIKELRFGDVIKNTSQVIFHDFRIKSSHQSTNSLQDAINASLQFFQSISSLEKSVHVVAGLTLRIAKGVLLPEATLVLDVLVVDNEGSKPRLIVGEIKSYPDRGGFTQRSSLASARAQAGLYVHALDLTIASESLENFVEVSRIGFLVLSKPGSNFPSVRGNEDFKWQAERARQGFEQMETSAAALNGKFAFDEDLPDQELLDLVLHAETNFQDSCVGFCERAPTCQQISISNDDGAFLGDEVVRFLNGLGLSAAESLSHSQTPQNQSETDFLQRFTYSESDEN